MEKVSIFVDVQNIYYTVMQTYRCHFEYNVFWSQVTRNRKILTAYAYAIERGDEKQLKFQEILRKIGFNVKLKPYIQRRDGSSKGDWDVGITLDMIHDADAADVLVLASGDGDFDLVVDKITKQYHKRVEVYGVQALTARSLINVATHFTPISGKLLRTSGDLKQRNEML